MIKVYGLKIVIIQRRRFCPIGEEVLNEWEVS